MRNISYLLQRRSRNGRSPLLLFFDETDRLADTERANNWPFLRLLHEAASNNWVRLTFAGFRSVASLLHTNQGAYRSPFHGSLEEITLGPLDRDDRKDLFSEPFRFTGIPIREAEAVTRRVLGNSAGHPFLIQFYGERLFRKAVAKNPQEITPEDVREIEEGSELSNFLLSHFLINTLDRGRPVGNERLCAFVYAHSEDGHAWTQQDFLQACGSLGHKLSLDEVHEALQNLHNSQVLTYERGRFKFTFPYLRDVLRISYPDIRALLEEL